MLSARTVHHTLKCICCISSFSPSLSPLFLSPLPPWASWWQTSSHPSCARVESRSVWQTAHHPQPALHASSHLIVCAMHCANIAISMSYIQISDSSSPSACAACMQTLNTVHAHCTCHTFKPPTAHNPGLHCMYDVYSHLEHTWPVCTRTFKPDVYLHGCHCLTSIDATLWSWT